MGKVSSAPVLSPLWWAHLLLPQPRRVSGGPILGLGLQLTNKMHSKVSCHAGHLVLWVKVAPSRLLFPLLDSVGRTPAPSLGRVLWAHRQGLREEQRGWHSS